MVRGKSQEYTASIKSALKQQRYREAPRGYSFGTVHSRNDHISLPQRPHAFLYLTMSMPITSRGGPERADVAACAQLHVPFAPLLHVTLRMPSRVNVLCISDACLRIL